jgi:hypothetical protein
MEAQRVSRVIEITDEQYDSLCRAAEHRGQTPEELLGKLIADGTRELPVYDDLDTFFRSLGASEEVIRESRRLFEDEERAGAQDGR